MISVEQDGPFVKIKVAKDHGFFDVYYLHGRGQAFELYEALRDLLGLSDGERSAINNRKDAPL